MILKSTDFESLLNFKFSSKVSDLIDSYKIELLPLSQQEYKNEIEDIKLLIQKPNAPAAGSHRINDWNSGWQENNLDFADTNNVRSLIPRYFNKFKNIRFYNQLYKINSLDCELNMLRVLQYYVCEKYCNDTQNFYEFGCGTGHNLFAISEIVDHNKHFFGFDWSNPPREIFKNIETNFGKNFKFDNLDFFNPNYDIKILENSAVFTFAALEQVGDKHEKFIQFLIDKQPDICIHIEPIVELLNPEDELQKLSIQYIEKRNYLSNFLSHLRELEKNNIIKLIDVDRTTIGSYLIEGYSLVAWKVNKCL